MNDNINQIPYFMKQMYKLPVWRDLQKSPKNNNIFRLLTSLISSVFGLEFGLTPGQTRRIGESETK
jgi:transposase